MSRLFSIIVTLFILVLVYLWIGHITDRDKQEQNPAPATVPASQVEVEAEQDTYSEDTQSQMMMEDGSGEELDSDDQPTGNDAQTADDQKVPSASSGGSHLVIVGNFLERANAEKHLSTVKDLGYPNAEILQFEISQYYTVCAGRYNNPTEARRIARKIKEQHGIDAYMRTVN